MFREKVKLYLYVLFLVALFFTGMSSATHAAPNGFSSIPANPSLNPYDARSYPDRLEIFKGDRKVSVIRSENPDIQQWGFIDSGNLVVVKSQDKSGQKVFELFDTATGTRRDKVVMSGAQKIPPWAKTLTE